MIYSPHILQIKPKAVVTFDKDRNPIVSANDWVEIGQCRCDDNGEMKEVSVNGKVFTPSYHVVYEGEKISPYTEVRCLEGEEVRGEGKVLKSTKCNRLNYAELWM